MPQIEDVTRELKMAGQFDVHKWSDYAEVRCVVDILFEQVIALRKQQNSKARLVSPEKVKKHLRVLLIDLYVASQSPNPWRGISKRKEDYKKNESRYRRIFLTYDFLIPLLNDLGSLGYIEEALGFHDPKTNKGFRTRIKATEKLLDLIYAKEIGIQEVIEKVGLAGLVTDNPEAEREIILLRDKDGKPVEYGDTEQTKAMRHNLGLINANLLKSRIVLWTSNEQFENLYQQLKGSIEQGRECVDFTRKTLHRVFNGDFRHGGRFYGGWWIGLPKEYRKYIEINRKHTVEVDFSAHHIRMLYARNGVEPPKDPYDIEGCPFARDVLKRVFLVLINASDKTATIKACAQHGIKDAVEILKILETHHPQIAPHFYSGMGLTLQYEDSVLAEEIMLRMMNRGATVLPVHDSFIVRESYEEELKQVMEEVFEESYGIKAAMKAKPTVLSNQAPDDNEPEQSKLKFVATNLEQLSNYYEMYSTSIKLFGN